MSRQEADREDLFQEAVALSIRAEWTLPGFDEPVTTGFRESGEFSVYFGQDLFYQFDPSGLLRRAFVDGVLSRSQPPRLISLTRHRDAGGTQLVRTELSESELAEFLAAMLRSIAALRTALVEGAAVLLRSHPAEADATREVVDFLNRIPTGGPWLSPTIRGRN